MQQFLVDAFATAPFRGNQACILEPFTAWPDVNWMQSLAAENNQAETAYLLATDDPSRFGLRWFTPLLEVPLCGHATLAASHVLWTELDCTISTLTFETASGPLHVARLDDGSYEMDFPSNPPESIAVPDGLEAALGTTIKEMWQGPYLVAVLDNEATVRALRPDIAAIERIARATTNDRGNLIVTAFADAGHDYDVVSRFFAPGSGIAEDPATGSAHCILAPLYARKTGKATARYFQAYPGRGGDLTCEVRGDRVMLRGRAVTVLAGELRV
jgi:PhzF family phenazine biosynthesis protein